LTLAVSVGDTCYVRPLNRAFAFFTLLAWLCAAGHVALMHGGSTDYPVHPSFSGAADDDDHDRDTPSRDREHHHHDLTGLDAAQWVKSADHKALAPVWLPLCNVFVERLTATLSEVSDVRTFLPLERSPPDARASGWLLVCHSALPVRGPSLGV